MARVLVTGSTAGLGEIAARRLLGDGHEVVLHARTAERARDVDDLASRAVGVVVGDLADLDEVRQLADRADALGGLDAVIHNAGISGGGHRAATPQGHARPLAVNVLAPYLLTARLGRPSRLVYLSSGMHRSGSASLADVDWTTRPWDGVQAYCDGKLLVTTLATALARRWPDVAVNAVDPGWVPTRMGGAGAPDDLEQGAATQTWLAVGADPEARTSGGYWFHRQREDPAPPVRDAAFQDAVLDLLADLTGQPLA